MESLDLEEVDKEMAMDEAAQSSAPEGPRLLLTPWPVKMPLRFLIEHTYLLIRCFGHFTFVHILHLNMDF